jgi:hypothetical protein
MISLIERGESSPTAAVLDRIATALDLPLAALFESAQAPAAPLSRPADRTAWRDPQTGYIRRNISPAGLTGGLQIVDVVLPPRAYVAYENGPELCLQQQVWVQEGRLDVTVGREIYRMAEDDCLAMRLTEPTAFRNPTQRVTRYIVVIASDRAKTARGHA